GRAEKYDRNTVARVHVMIAPAIRIRRVAILVERIVEAKRLLLFCVYAFVKVAELGRETASADDDERIRTAGGIVHRLAATPLVHVDLADRRIARHRGVLGEV